ncbi:MAG: lectin like domain-containing protein, partial [Clostridiales bacterium]|nr:lectin like domain-containing protein [Clostridiales bacterium]
MYDYSPFGSSNYTLTWDATGSVSVANVFDCTDSSATLTDIQFYNSRGPASYEVYVAKGATGKVSDEKLLASALTSTAATGTFTYDGYYTIDVTDLGLNNNESFAIIVKSDLTGSKKQINLENTTQNTKTSSRQSFVSLDEGNVWTDLENRGNASIQAIVSGGTNHVDQPRKTTGYPSVSITSPTLGAPNVTDSDSLVLSFDETVTPVAGKKITIFRYNKLYTYSGDQAIPSQGSSSFTNGYTILASNSTVTGTGNACIATIPLASFPGLKDWM